MYILLLILKYLLKRRIAWVSLAAVMLCTTMVLVVISVMGGWLEMFKQSFHGLDGDIIVKSESLAGFAHYQEMIRQIEGIHGVAAAVPEIETFGLLNIGSVPTSAVKVIGIPIDRIGQVNAFPDSLYRQHTLILDELKRKDLSSEVRAELQRELAATPSFALLDRSSRPLANLPADVKLSDAASGRFDGLTGKLASAFWWDAARRTLVFKGIMTTEELDQLRGLSQDRAFKDAVSGLFEYSNSGRVVDYQAELPRSRQDVTKWPGLIPGIGVIYIHRNAKGDWISPLGPRVPLRDDPGIYGTPVKLTVLGIHPGESSLDINNKAERNYWIIDDSRTQLWQLDNNSVYVPFEQLQSDLGMGERTATDVMTKEQVTLPARITEIHVRVGAGYTSGQSLSALEASVSDTVKKILDKYEPTEAYTTSRPFVETWLEKEGTWINAVEHEKFLVTFLFAIISVVAIFLIFCIFYMIVMEKTKDIGIIKSVGASNSGVAGIFLGYGLTIGVIGALMGVLLSYLIVHNINELHTWLGAKLGIVIWNPEVYIFDKIPDRIAPINLLVIPLVAIVASVLGALLPAMRAASMNPVESLRWE